MPEFRPLAGVMLPPVARAALLLDLDGTLLDIAPSPDAVVVPPALAATLRAWRERLDGALAIVTGRPVAQIDGFLPGVATAVAGEHGGALRLAAEAPLLRPDLPELPPAWLAAAERLVAAHPGALLERKQRGFAVHYRAAPAAGPALRAGLAALLGTQPGFAVLAAAMAWEVRPTGADKGTAVARIMAAPPFAGRVPIFVGDDVTDEDGMAEARRLGGLGLRVDAHFGDAAGVRAWLS